jgi:L-lactate dehydrogenase complex protein LldE
VTGGATRLHAGGTVQFFATCIVEHVRPQVGLAAISVLERLGVTVVYAEGQTCCGQPAFNAGAREDARHMARCTVDCLSRSELPVVVPSGSCADMIVHQFPALLANDPGYAARARSLALRTVEFTQAVASLDPAFAGSSVAQPVAYHATCHLLRGMSVRSEPVALLDAAVGAGRVELPGADECCGFGGLFSVKMSEISSAMLARKLDCVEASRARTLVACDASCLLHLEGGLRRRGSDVEVKHLAEVLDGCVEVSGRDDSSVPDGRR